jgi:hypothetical protein
MKFRERRCYVIYLPPTPSMYDNFFSSLRFFNLFFLVFSESISYHLERVWGHVWFLFKLYLGLIMMVSLEGWVGMAMIFFTFLYLLFFL